MDTQGISEIEQRRKEPKHTFRHIGFQNEEQSDEIFIFNLLQIKDARMSYIHLEIEIWLRIIHKQSTLYRLAKRKHCLNHRIDSNQLIKESIIICFQLTSIVFRNRYTSSEKFSLCQKLLNLLYLNKIFYTIFLVSLAESLSLCQNPLYCIQYYEISQRSEQKTKHKLYKSKYMSLYLCKSLCTSLSLSLHYPIGSNLRCPVNASPQTGAPCKRLFTSHYLHSLQRASQLPNQTISQITKKYCTK